MNRYKFTHENVSQAIKFLKGKSEVAPTWAKRFKGGLTTKDGKVFFEKKQIVAAEDVDEILRDEIYKKDGDVCSGRDAAFHTLKQRYIGIGRRSLMAFIRAQKPLGEVKEALKKPKRKSGKPLKTYTFETDLIFLKKNDLEEANKKFINDEIPELSYILTTVEKVTGLVRFSYVLSKKASVVSPLVVQHCEEMCEALKVDIGKTELYSDAGGEFNLALFKPIFKKAENVPTGSSVENKNRQCEQTFFRILRQRKAKNIRSALEQSQKLLNNQYNRIHKKTPNEMVERNEEKTDITEYNSQRKSYIAGDNRKPFEVGTYVRLQVKSDKPSLKDRFYKNTTFSRAVYLVKKITKTTPRKYWVNSRWRTQDVLLLSAPRDEISNQLVEERDMTRKQREKKKEKKHMKARLADVGKPKAGLRRSTRQGAISARLDMLESREKEQEFDKELEAEEIAEEKAEIVEEKKQLKADEKKLGIEPKKQEAPPKKEKDKTTKYRKWLLKRGLPSTGDLNVLRKRVALKKKIDALKKQKEQFKQKYG